MVTQLLCSFVQVLKSFTQLLCSSFFGIEDERSQETKSNKRENNVEEPPIVGTSRVTMASNHIRQKPSLDPPSMSNNTTFRSTKIGRPLGLTKGSIG